MCVSCSAPDFPPRGCKATALSSTSFRVMWSSPDPPNGDIANYTIVYRPVEAVADYDPSTLEGSMTRYTDANTTVLMAMVHQSAVLYSIQLAATNQVGISPFSQDLECTVLTQDDGELIIKGMGFVDCSFVLTYYRVKVYSREWFLLMWCIFCSWYICIC